MLEGLASKAVLFRVGTPPLALLGSWMELSHFSRHRGINDARVEMESWPSKPLQVCSGMLHESSFYLYFLGGIKDGQTVDVQRALYNMINMLSLQTQKVFTTFPAHFPEHLFFWSWFCSFMQGCDAKSEGLGRWEAFKVKHLGAGFHEHLGIGEWSRYTAILMETLHESHQPQEFNRFNLTTANAIKGFCELLGVQRLECATECRLAKPKLKLTLPGSTGICKKKLGWFNQQDASMATKICLPATWPNHTKLRRFKKQDSPPKNLWSQGQTARSMHPLSAMSWALLLCTGMGPLLGDSKANLYSLYPSTCTWAKLHTPKNTHTMVTSIRWTSPCLFHQQMKSHGHGHKPMTIIPSIQSCKTVATLQNLPSFPPRALR